MARWEATQEAQRALMERREMERWERARMRWAAEDAPLFQTRESRVIPRQRMPWEAPSPVPQRQPVPDKNSGLLD